MDKAESDFVAIRALVSDAHRDPENIGWYMNKSYWLGRGASVDETFQPPPSPERRLRVVCGEAP